MRERALVRRLDEAHGKARLTEESSQVRSAKHDILSDPKLKAAGVTEVTSISEWPWIDKHDASVDVRFALHPLSREEAKRLQSHIEKLLIDTVADYLELEGGDRGRLDFEVETDGSDNEPEYRVWGDLSPDVGD